MSFYDEDYYMNGLTTGKSNYERYSWKPDLTLSWAHHLRRLLSVKEHDRVLDVGCATGNYVRALRMLGIDAWGYDVSEWAVANSDASVRPFLSNHLNGAEYDLIFSKDCFEHIPHVDLFPLVCKLLKSTERMFVIVPLAAETNGRYVHEKEEKDPSHVNRWTLSDWLRFFESCSPSFIVSGSYRYPGLKPGSAEVDCGYGFFLCTRI
jgi:predicted TPR repeat methyltransferase